MGEVNGALSDVRVLDLAEERGLYAGKMLADLGAEVILVENPEGGKARRTGPFRDDMPALENSLYFFNFNTNKKGITLDLGKSEAQDIFKQLVARSDVVIEDGPVGRMPSLGLGYEALRELNRGIIMASITGFGQTGPYNSFKAPDLVSFAMGGLMNENGPAEAPPVVAPCEQSYQSVSVASAAAILAALFLRVRTGEGQMIDASAHEVMATLCGGMFRYSSSTQIGQRRGSQFGAVPGRIYPCKDGYVHILTIRPNHWRGFLEVIGNPEMLSGEEWVGSGLRNRNVEIIDAYVTEFTMTHTKMEITEMCQEKGVPCTPVNDSADFERDAHIRERGVFGTIAHPLTGSSFCLKPPCRLSGTPCRTERSAPLLGQHNREIYCGELGYTDAGLAELRARGVI